MTVPVLQQLLEQHPHLKVTVVSNAAFAPLFAGIDRCRFHPASLKTTHRGIRGMLRLFRELRQAAPVDAVADLHGVLRSTLLRLCFRASGYRTAVINKGRAAKKALTRKSNKVLQPLPSGFERYASVFRELGLSLQLQPNRQACTKKALPGGMTALLPAGKPAIGVAPFAQHAGKMYPAEKMKTVIRMLSERHAVYLLGGGKAEAEQLQQWADEIPGVSSLAGQYAFADELAFISQLRVMVSMDSANMHLASLYGVPVVSVWGATHPFAGFYGWGQDPARAVSVELSCRPCSVFGNKPCWRGDHACMEQIHPLQIVEQVEKTLGTGNGERKTGNSE